ncbi:MAG: hypothetical protein KF767_16810 [Bdellovibrionaceae bacterium]|nr:hypothetical protein [Pseudobdellovibrionaceae bacterium]
MNLFRGKIHQAWVLVFALSASLSSAAQAPTETPITRIKADYLCALGERGEEVVGFTLAGPGAPARVWLGMADNDMGLEPEVSSFTYAACAGCFTVSARYSFSGGLNLLHFETVDENANFIAGPWPPRPPEAVVNPDQEEPIELPEEPGENLWRPFWIVAPNAVDCDLPPGMELPPECRQDDPCDVPPGMEPPPECRGDDDRPPGSDPWPEPTPTPTPEEPVTPVGPPLRVRYYETSADGARILFQSQGLCRSTR